MIVEMTVILTVLIHPLSVPVAPTEVTISLPKTPACVFPLANSMERAWKEYQAWEYIAASA